MIVIGADPGKPGALAMVDGDKLIDAIRIPYSAPEVGDERGEK